MIKRLLLTILILLVTANCFSASFPTTSILDSFGRSDGDLDASADWTQIPEADDLGIASNVVGASGVQPYGFAGDYWVDDTYTDCEAYITVTTKPATGAVIYLIVRGKDMGSSLLLMDGYALLITTLAGTDSWSLFRMTNGSVGSAITSGTQEITNGDKFGILADGTTITAWYAPQSTGTWEELDSGTDSEYGSAGNIVVIVSDMTVRIDDFGGGTIVEPSTTDFFQLF